jgi:hypothetical protein
MNSTPRRAWALANQDHARDLDMPAVADACEIGAAHDFLSGERS